jgi:hypothetical protein
VISLVCALCLLAGSCATKPVAPQPVLQQPPVPQAAPKKAAPEEEPVVEENPPVEPASQPQKQTPPVEQSVEERELGVEPEEPSSEKPAPKEPATEKKPVAEIAAPPAAEPEKTAQPAPAPAKKFDASKITKEQFDTTKSEIQKFIDDLNGIIQAKNYTAWKAALAPAYLQKISSPDYLYKFNNSIRLRLNRIVLRNVYDYFTYVVVPSRANYHVDDIVFINDNRVKAYTMNKDGERLRLYELEKRENVWKIVN